MSRKKWRSSALALGLSTALLVSACAGGSSPLEASSGADEVVSGDRQQFAGTTLRLLLKEGYEIAAIQSYEAEFEEATGINVEIEVYDEPTARSKMVLDATAGTGNYDITSGSFWNMPEFVKAGWLEPLDDYFANKVDEEWLIVEDLPLGALESLTVGGQLYGMPHTIIGGGFFYRTDVFDELGLAAPQNTDDILAAGAVIAEKRPDLIPFSARGASTFASLGTLLGWAYGYDALLFDADNNPQANSPEMVEAMEDFVTMMKDYGAPDASTLTFTQAGEKFSSGAAAMMFDTSAFGTVFENTDSKSSGLVGYSLPVGPAGKNLQWLYNEGLAITANSGNKDAAWLFLQWRMSRDVTMKELLELGRTDVPNLGVLGSPEYAAYMSENGLDEYSVFIQDSWNATTAEHWPFFPEFAQIGDTFATEMSNAIAGSKSVSDALDSAQASLTLIMKEAGYIQ